MVLWQAPGLFFRIAHKIREAPPKLIFKSSRSRLTIFSVILVSLSVLLIVSKDSTQYFWLNHLTLGCFSFYNDIYILYLAISKIQLNYARVPVNGIKFSPCPINLKKWQSCELNPE